MASVRRVAQPLRGSEIPTSRKGSETWGTPFSFFFGIRWLRAQGLKPRHIWTRLRGPEGAALPGRFLIGTHLSGKLRLRYGRATTV